MQLRQLEYVVAAVEEGTFTAAATRCHVAQPSLSSAIGQLERELGTLLFHRVGRRISPTSACERLLVPARDALRAMAVAEAVGRARGVDEVVGRVDLAVQPTLAATTAVRLIARLREQHPAVTVRVLSPNDEEAVGDLVSSGRCEVGLGERPPDATLRWTRVEGEGYVLVHPPGDPTRGIAALGAAPVVAPPPGTPTRLVLDEVCAAAGVVPDVVVEAEHRDALLPLVAAGVGAALLPASSLPAELPPGVETEMVGGRRRSIGLIARPGALTPAAAALRRVARSLAQTPPHPELA